MKWVLRVLSWLGFAGFALWLVAKAAGANGLRKSLIDLPDFPLFGVLSKWRIDSDLTPMVTLVVVGFAVGLAFVVLSLSGPARWLADAVVNTVVALGIVGLRAPSPRAEIGGPWPRAPSRPWGDWAWPGGRQARPSWIAAEGIGFYGFLVSELQADSQ